MIGERLVAVPGTEGSSVALFVGSAPVLASVVIEDNRRIGFGSQKKRAVLDRHPVPVFFLHLFQPNGGIIAPGSAVVVKNENLQGSLAHDFAPVSNGRNFFKRVRHLA